GDPYKYYHSLAKQGKLWATTTVEKNAPANDLSKRDTFEGNWRKFVHEQYIHNIEVWTCTTAADVGIDKRIESQIQTTLKFNYGIGSHIHNTGMCWLGKIEYGAEAFDTPY